MREGTGSEVGEKEGQCSGKNHETGIEPGSPDATHVGAQPTRLSAPTTVVFNH